MSNREKLMALVDKMNDGTVEYFLTFISLFKDKWGGAFHE